MKAEPMTLVESARTLKGLRQEAVPLFHEGVQQMKIACSDPPLSTNQTTKCIIVGQKATASYPETNT